MAGLNSESNLRRAIAATGEVIDLVTQQNKMLTEALERLCGFIGESLEARSMNSVALEQEWHRATNVLRAVK